MNLSELINDLSNQSIINKLTEYLTKYNDAPVSVMGVSDNGLIDRVNNVKVLLNYKTEYVFDQEINDCRWKDIVTSYTILP